MLLQLRSKNGKIYSSCAVPFSFKPNEWLEWLDEFARYRNATKLHKEEGVVIICNGGQQARRIFRTLTFVAPEVDTKYEIGVLVSKLMEYFIPLRNVIHERCVFQSRQQLASESVEEFARQLQTIAVHCEYKKHTNEMVRDRFVMGVRDQAVKEKLQLISDLNLDKAMTIGLKAKHNMKSALSLRPSLRSKP